MSKYEINWNKLLYDNLPIPLRKPVIQGFLQALIAPVVILHGRFAVKLSADIYESSHFSHVAHLESVLNDQFDSGFRRIQITDAPLELEPHEVFQSIESHESFLSLQADAESDFILWREDESMFGGVDFYIEIPNTIIFDPSLLQAVVRKYKNPGASVEVKII